MKLPLLKRPDPSATGETAAVKKKRPALKKLGRKKLIALVAAAALVIGLGSHALLGGSAGAWAGMYLFHHKTKHWYFVVGMPLILAAQLAAGVWLAGNSGLV